MECPYCVTKNIPGHPVCAGCGAILQNRVGEKSPSRPSPKKRTLRLLSFTHAHQARQRHAALQRRIKDVFTLVEERTQAALKLPIPPTQSRLNLAVLHLLRGETDAGRKVLQIARQFGATGAEFENNTGVGLARLGNLPDALRRFSLAAGQADAGIPPAANTAAALCEIFDDREAGEKALQSVRVAMSQDGKNPLYYNRLSQIFCHDQRWAEAEAQARRALTLAGADAACQADARCALGVALFAAGSIKEASAEFSTALELSPGHAPALANLALLQDFDPEKTEAAPGLHRLQEAAVIDPENPGIQASLGHALCQAGMINEGIRALHRALTLRPYLWQACYNLGKAYADVGLPEVAEPYLARVVQMAPWSWEVMLTHGAVFIALKRPAHAIGCFEQVLARRPRDLSALAGLGVSLALCGKHHEAERQFQAAERVQPDSPLIAGHRAWLHLLRDSASLAAAELEVALKKDPERAVFHNNYGLAHLSLGSPELGLLHFQRALALNPNLSTAHYNLGCTHALFKRVEDAITAWERAAEFELTNADCFSNLGTAYFLKGNYDAALPHFRRVVQIRQDRAFDYARLGLTYAKQGVALRQSAQNANKGLALLGPRPEEKLKQAAEKHRLAIAQFDTALEMDPGNVILHSNRGLACYFIGHAEEAMQEWARVTQLDPLYARRRGKTQQSEFDASQMEFLPLKVPERAQLRSFKTADYLPRLVGGYDTEEWMLVISDPDLAQLPALLRESHDLERLQRSLAL